MEIEIPAFKTYIGSTKIKAKSFSSFHRGLSDYLSVIR